MDASWRFVHLLTVESDWLYSSYNLGKCSSKGQENVCEVQTKEVERWYGLNDQMKKKTPRYINHLSCHLFSDVLWLRETYLDMATSQADEVALIKG